MSAKGKIARGQLSNPPRGDNCIEIGLNNINSSIIIRLLCILEQYVIQNKQKNLNTD